MNRFTGILVFIFFTSLFKLSAQTTELKTFKFDKVDPSEFDIKFEGHDSAAAAIKIFDIGTGHFEISPVTGNFVYIFERQVRYRIINKSAYELADLEIPLYSPRQGAAEKLDRIKGATYNLVNHQVVISKMNNEAKFSNRTDKNHIVKKFTLPNVKEGSIIDYSYRTVSDFIYKLDDWYFQGSYPCKYAAFTLKVPQYLLYNIDVSGYVDIIRLKPVEFQETYRVPKENSLENNLVIASASKDQFYAENIPAIKDEKYITTLEDYVSKIGFELASTTYGSDIKNYSATWKSIIDEDLEKDEGFGKFIVSGNYTRGLMSGIIKNETDPEAKMNLIFNYVKNNIKWNNQYNIYTGTASPREVLERKTGNSAEINLCLLVLLNEAGINAAPVLISTRKNGAHSGHPLLTKFNNLIVDASVNGKWHLLDAIDKNNTPDIISFQNLNHKGLVLDLAHSGAKWVTLEDSGISRSTTMYNLKLDADNKFTGSLYLSSSNHAALSRRNLYQSSGNEAGFAKNYSDVRVGLILSDYKAINMDQPDQLLEETMDVTIDDNTETAGNLVYFTPLLYERTKENPFNSDERKFPVDFAYPFENSYKMMVEFPLNYQLDKLPKNESFSLSNNDGSFSITYTAEGNKIAIRSKISISKSVFTAEEYFNLKELYKNIVRKQAEQIVFKKS